MLALLVGCALCRNELVELEIETIQQREGRWVLTTSRARAATLNHGIASHTMTFNVRNAAFGG